jgi:hypothetical protein
MTTAAPRDPHELTVLLQQAWLAGMHSAEARKALRMSGGELACYRAFTNWTVECDTNAWVQVTTKACLNKALFNARKNP